MNLESIPWDGTPITKPGMYSGIPMISYHGNICDGPSVSTTGLKKLIGESPADFWDTSYMNPDRAEDKETSALIFGRAIHHLILGEPHFQKVFAEQPSTYEDEKTGEIKKWTNAAHACKRWDAARAKENRYVLTKSEVEGIRGIARSLATHPLVQAGVLNGLVERSLFWKDRKTGIWLKHRPDVIPTDSGDICDLKKIRSVDWDQLRRNIFDFGYYQQGALSKWALKEVLDIDMQSFMLLFVEDKRPFSVRPVILKDIDLEIGTVANRAALDIMARCLKEDRWPGPGGLNDDHVEYIEMDTWQKNSIALKLKLMNYDTPDFEGKR
jgi:hypothetical protein